LGELYVELGDLRQERQELGYEVSGICGDVEELWSRVAVLIEKLRRVGCSEKKLVVLRKLKKLLKGLQVCGADVGEELAEVKLLIRLYKKLIKEENRVVRKVAKRLRQYRGEDKDPQTRVVRSNAEQGLKHFTHFLRFTYLGALAWRGMRSSI